MKKANCCNESWKHVGLLALRVAIGLIFINHGWDKLGDIAGTAAMFAQGGMPAATFVAWLAGLIEFVGGLAVLFGVYTRLAAKVLAAEMIIAILLVHTKLPWEAAELAIALLGGSLALAGFGAGKWRLMQTECICGKKGNCCGGGKCTSKEDSGGTPEHKEEERREGMPEHENPN